MNAEQMVNSEHEEQKREGIKDGNEATRNDPQMSTGETECWGSRHTLAFLGFLGLGLLYAMRVGLSVAIVAMVKADVGRPTVAGNRSSDSCPFPEDDGSHSWDETTQGVLLGAFFYGSLCSNFLGGRLAEHLGGKLVLGMGILLSALFALLTPLCVEISTALFAVVRGLQGAALVGAAARLAFASGLCLAGGRLSLFGVSLPAMNVLLASWIPPTERSKFTTFVFNGVDFGVVVTMVTSGWLCDSNFLGGWPLVFYVHGCLGLLWSVAWFLLVSDLPQTHPRISEQERNYIVGQCETIPIPWRALLTSLPVWSILLAHFGNNWGSFSLLAELPSYLHNIHHFDMKSNGMLSALPYLALWLFSLAYSAAMDRLLSSGRLSVIAVRKVSMAIASLGRALGLLALCFVGCDSVAVIAAICVSVGLGGSVYCGFMCSHQDLAPNLAGTLMGLSLTVGSAPGFLAPLLSGVIVSGDQTLAGWRTVFIISASVYVLTGFVYISFITAEQQSWNNVEEKEKKTKKGEKHVENTLPRNTAVGTQAETGPRVRA
ncbi:putative inorganic phosphate cotransporter [Penaeus monodon]|uniref:putative inorganic phosphate cotransporter n=1 Tax=Penaeus monodon TaxID=6687 RepID=UPI0018A6F481|nr:putative inorganic phosphate cotransporter [Penaeus monodon]